MLVFRSLQHCQPPNRGFVVWSYGPGSVVYVTDWAPDLRTVRTFAHRHAQRAHGHRQNIVSQRRAHARKNGGVWNARARRVSHALARWRIERSSPRASRRYADLRERRSTDQEPSPWAWSRRVSVPLWLWQEGQGARVSANGEKTAQRSGQAWACESCV